jgi:hypothetical protein
MATVKAASAVHVAANDSCERSRQGFRAVAEKARADAVSRFRAQLGVAGSITSAPRVVAVAVDIVPCDEQITSR